VRRGDVKPSPKDAKKDSPKRELRIPHDAVNEQVVIAAALIVDGEMRKKLLAQLSSDVFYGDGHKAIWDVLNEATRRNLALDPATLHQLSGDIDAKYVEQLTQVRPDVPPNLTHHVDCIRWDSTRVECARGPLSSLIEAIRDPRSDPERVRALARQTHSSLEGSGAMRYMRDPAALVRETIGDLEARRHGVACFDYGLPGLDYNLDTKERRLLPGAAPGNVTILTGTSGSGKSTAVCAMAVHLANEARRTLFGAWEMGAKTTLELCASISLGVSRSRITTGDVTDDEVERLRDEMDRLAGFIRFFDIPFGRARGEKTNNDKNLDLVHGYIAESGCDVFIADLFRRSLANFDPEEEEKALYRIQSITAETKVHSILLHQQNLKTLEGRADKRPTREGAKGSSAWVDVADTMFGFNRPALWKQVEDNVIECVVLKQRRGRWPFMIEFDWDSDLGQITNGREVDYARPGETTDLDEALEREKSALEGKSKKTRRKWNDK
jgi:archaellum biogenesis ATPase FlaH